MKLAGGECEENGAKAPYYHGSLLRYLLMFTESTRLVDISILHV